MCPKLLSRKTLRFKGSKTNWFPKGAVIKCFVIYPIEKIAAYFSKKVFLLYKLYILIIIYSSRSPSDGLLTAAKAPWAQGLVGICIFTDSLP